MTRRARGETGEAAGSASARKRARGVKGASSLFVGGGRAATPDDEDGEHGAGGGAPMRPDTPSLFGRCLLAVAEADRQATAPSSLLAPPSPLAAPLAAAASAAASGSAAPGSAAPATHELPASPRHALAIAFKLNTHPSGAEVSALGTFLRLEPEVVAAWFDRRRQLEVWARDMARDLLAAGSAGGGAGGALPAAGAAR
ncbi:hypothetical protein KFE25_012269 [Diacronema lutheri]|uniref:Homeobox domain-containing protein n=1 Tax=Diacronema lutheri TaxID=2081491 RepID=A0A8J5XAF7_DIALT|nr:hypothetical protein KFE25_012269 [Diacronema lutheri]